jgi:nucleotidyltransferase AbiEii toxin of type IV toxin-antitoxin system
VSYKPPKRPPGDRSHLERLVQELSVEEGIAADRLRRWVSTQILLGALARREDDDDERRFLLKGGVAMELRLRLRARATKDVDIIVIPDEDGDVIDALQEALEEPYLNFGFRLTRVQSIGDTPAQRMDVKMTYRDRPWATLRLEASPPGAERTEAEVISAFSLTQLGLEGPEQVACQSLRYQIATKLHAVTERFQTGENDRFRDLIDLLLLGDLEPDLAQVAEACRDVFSARGKQFWPPHLSIEPSWPEQYRALAIEQGFSIQDAAEAAERVQEMIDAIAVT